MIFEQLGQTDCLFSFLLLLKHLVVLKHLVHENFFSELQTLSALLQPSYRIFEDSAAHRLFRLKCGLRQIPHSRFGPTTVSERTPG